MKLLFISLGCDKNLVDTEKMLGLLGHEGYSFVDDETVADIIVVNTCDRGQHVLFHSRCKGRKYQHHSRHGQNERRRTVQSPDRNRMSCTEIQRRDYN